MKYKNVELTELQPSDWDGHPRLMLVWRNSDYYPSALRVEGYVHLEGHVYWITTIESVNNSCNCNAAYDNTIKLQNTYPHCAEIPAIESIYQERIKDLEEQVTRMHHNANEREDEFRRQYQEQERRFREEIERVRNENANAYPSYKLKEVMEIKLPDSLIKELLSKKFGKYKQDFLKNYFQKSLVNINKILFGNGQLQKFLIKLYIIQMVMQLGLSMLQKNFMTMRKKLTIG